MSSIHSSPAPQAADVWKRKYQALEASTTLAQSKSKSLGATQRSLGRGLRRMVAMFHTVRDLVGESDCRAENEASGEDATYTDEDDRLLRAYEELGKQMPVLKKLLDQQTDPELLDSFYRNLRKGSDMARGDDAGNLKLAVVVWVDEIFGPSQPPLKPTSKDECGLENDNTGRLLCPGEYKWDDA
ncbi:hypothetical protein PILCRDRAFT_3812, partial [Piloderma croceum F 1598]